MKNINLDRQSRRKFRVSKNLFGGADKPRISIFKSNKYIYAQAIDDKARKTITDFSTFKLEKNSSQNKTNKTAGALAAGKELAKLLLEKKIKKAVFDRGKYIYKGRVKALAEGLRAGGITI